MIAFGQCVCVVGFNNICSKSGTNGDMNQSLFFAVVVLLGTLYLSGTFAFDVYGQSTTDDSIPDWIKTIFLFYANGQIGDSELTNAIEFLISVGVISVESGDVQQDASNSSFDEGYAIGFDEGYALGSEDGYAIGFDEGHRMGFDEGDISGFDEGYALGSEDGYAMGSDVIVIDEYEDLGDFYLVYEDNLNSEYYVFGDTSRAWLIDNEILDYDIEFLNENFRLPYDVAIVARECGTANAFYYPSDKMIVICYEYIDHMYTMWYHFNEDDIDPYWVDEYLHDVVIETLYHEVGHAIIDIYDLPATGKEENVVDQFSALILLSTYDDELGYEVGQRMLYNVGKYYLYSDWYYEYDRIPYWNTHSLNIERFYNIACYTYGASPETFDQILIDNDWLPEDRKVWCEDEYNQISYAWAHILADYTNGVFW